MKIIIFAGMMLVTATCDGDKCRPGNYDGAWDLISTPPPINSIKESLVGMSSEDAENFLGNKAMVTERKADGTNRITWAFERRRTLVHKTCTRPDDVLISQRFIIVNVDIVNDHVSACRIIQKGSLSKTAISIEGAMNGGRNPFDGEEFSCDK